MRKRNNNFKRAQALAKTALKDKVILSVPTHVNMSHFYDIKKGIETKPTLEMANIIADLRFKWDIVLAVFMREKNGKLKTALKPSPAPYACHQYQLVDSLNQAHMDFVNEYDRDLICGAGWIASPYKLELTDQQIDEILTKFGAYEYLAPWQEQAK